MLVILVILTALGWYGWSRWEDASDKADAVGLVVMLILSVITAVAVVSSAVEHVRFRPMLAGVAQVRAAVERLGCRASHDVIGGATEFNAAVASRRAYNATWWADQMIPDGWDTVTAIAIPECR